MFDFPASPSVGQIYQPTGGPSWQWDGVAWKNTSSEAELQIVRTFIPGGAAVVNYTYNKPANLRMLEFEGTAPGGSGSGAAATAASTFSFGSGGSAGAWGKKLFQAAALPASVVISIGALGAATLGAGSDGGNVTFGSLITLPGGPGGIQGSNTTGSNVLSSQTTQGAAPTGVDIGAAGARGYQSIANIFAGANSMIGGGGPNPYGSAFPTWTTINTPGIAGSGWGVGGASAANGASQSARLGGAGAPGFVMLTEYLITEPGPAYVTAEEFNRIVNGAMQHSQENGGTLGATTLYYVADQFYLSFTGPSVNVQNVGVPGSPIGRYRLRSIVTTPKASLAATDYYSINTNVEGYSIIDACWGTSAAKQMVLRFGFKGPAGTYAAAIRNNAADRAFTKTFTISAGEANTDTVQTIVVPGCKDGTWNADNTLGLTINFQFAAGSNFLAPTDGVWNNANYTGVTGMSNGAAAANTFEIFDVGLYLDPGNTGVAPPWKIPGYGEELARCQRYYCNGVGWPIIAGYAGAGGGFYGHTTFPVTMRANPTVALNNQAPSNAGALGSLVQGFGGFRCGASVSGAGAGYVTFNFTANARM